MKIVAARSLGSMEVFDLEMDHTDHSFLLGNGVVAHNCGFLIANRPISEFVPLTTISGNRVTSYTAESVEAVGGLKMDFLTVNVLNDIQHAIEMIGSRAKGPFPAGGLEIDGKFVPGHFVVVAPGGAFYDIWDLPADQDVFSEVATGKTETVFQFDTPGSIQWLQQFNYRKPNGNYIIDSIEAMAAFTALNRKGPLDARISHPENDSKHNMLVEYARRARGESGSLDVLPVFDKLLPETYGVMVFQEQLQKMYQELTGCSGPAAEDFRNLVAKKKTEKLQKLYTPFIEAAGRTLGVENAAAVWQGFMTWSGYGFNKSHAVCYSVTAYACAWLKHHYPLEWWTAVLRNAEKNEVNEKFWRHCGHLIDLPDVKLSGAKFEIQNERIRAPISLLQGVGDSAHAQLTAGVPYTDINDFCQKIEQHRMAGATIVKKVKKEKVKESRRRDEVTKKIVYDQIEVETDVVKKGRSSLHSGVIKTLILSGAMDSLFPPEMHVGEQFVEFERAFAEATGAKKPKKVDPKVWDLDPIQRYQTRKAILPAYGTNLVQMFLQTQSVPDLSIDQISNQPVFMWDSPNGKRVGLAVVNAAGLERCIHMQLAEGESLQVAVAAHIDEARVFRYGEDRREAIELQLDVEGARFKLVRWAGRALELTASLKAPLKGAVVMAILNRWRSDKGFSIDDIIVIRPPLDDVKEKDEPEE